MCGRLNIVVLSFLISLLLHVMVISCNFFFIFFENSTPSTIANFKYKNEDENDINLLKMSFREQSLT